MDPFGTFIKPKGSNNEVQTLDLLTECLESVHRTRKASLINRKKAYEVRAQRKKEHAQSMSRLTLRTTQTGSLGLDGELGEEDDEELMEEYSVQFASKVNIEEKPEASKRSEKAIPDPPSPLFRGNQHLNFDSLDAAKDDMKAAASFDEFRTELQGWWGNKINAASRQNEEVRGEYADYLTEKYLSNKLDPLPPSRTISAVRKEILSIIETFASNGYLPSNFSEIAFSIEPVDAIGAKANVMMASDIATELRKKIPVSAPLLEDDIENSAIKEKKKTPAQVKTEAAQKKEAEKEKIKKQYEAYMKLKSNNNTVIDKQREKEFEELNSDIKDLLSTIQNKPKEVTKKK